jgi:hypothetical protein
VSAQVLHGPKLGYAIEWWQPSKVVQNTWDTVVSSSTDQVLGAYQGTGSDGRDPGANIDFVNWATAGAVTGAEQPVRHTSGIG